MFDIGFWELSLIAVISLLILGPERLPRVARTAGLWISKMKRMVADVKSNIDEELRMEELKELQKAGQDLKQGLSETQKELDDAASDLRNAVETKAQEVESSVDGSAEAPPSEQSVESVDIVSAINEAAPKAEDSAGERTASPVSEEKTTRKAAKAKSKRKVAKKTKKVVRKTRTDGRSAAKKASRKKTSTDKTAGKTEEGNGEGAGLNPNQASIEQDVSNQSA